MSEIIDGIEIPVEIEVQGRAAIAEYVAKHKKPALKAPAPPKESDA